MSREMSEDRLVQENTANFFRDELKWDSVYAYNDETFGPTGTLGRMSDRDIYLVRYIREALEKFNSKLPLIAYETAVKQILEISVSKSLTSMNKEKYSLFKSGVLVEYRNGRGELESRRLKVFDFETPENQPLNKIWSWKKHSSLHSWMNELYVQKGGKKASKCV